MEFKEKLRTYRKERGYTQAAIAKLIGCARSTISELENGSRIPSLKVIEKIASATNSNVSEWICEDSQYETSDFDGLKLVIKALIDTDKIDNQGNMTDEAKAMAMKMLEKEVKLIVMEKNQK